MIRISELKKLCESVRDNANQKRIGIYFGHGYDPDGSLEGYTKQEIFNMGILEAFEMVIDYLEDSPRTLIIWAQEDLPTDPDWNGRKPTEKEMHDWMRLRGLEEEDYENLI